MTIQKKRPRSASSTKKPPKKRLEGTDYLGHDVKDRPPMSIEEKVAFARAIERGFAVASRIQFMFALRDVVSGLVDLARTDQTLAAELGQTDPVLQLLDEAGDAAKDFIDSCSPLLELIPLLGPALKRLDAYLDSQPVIEANRLSLTPRQLVGIYVARAEGQNGRGIRLEPKELSEFFKDIDLFHDTPPTIGGWKEILWKSRGRRDEKGGTISEKHRGSLRSDLEFAAKRGGFESGKKRTRASRLEPAGG